MKKFQEPEFVPNKEYGRCYRCGGPVKEGVGHVEYLPGGSYIYHRGCFILAMQDPKK